MGYPHPLFQRLLIIERYIQNYLQVKLFKSQVKEKNICQRQMNGHMRKQAGKCPLGSV